MREATGKESPTLQRLAQPITTTRIGVWRTVVAPEQWRAIHAELDRGGNADLVEQLIAETDAIRAEAAQETHEVRLAQTDRA